MSRGKLIRIGLFVICLSVYMGHTITHFIYSSGLRSYTNINAVIKQHLGKEYAFRIVHPLIKVGKGKIYTKVFSQETYFVIQQRFVIHDVNVSDQQLNLAKQFFNKDKRVEDAISIIQDSESRSITGTMSMVYDDKCRLASVKGEFEALGISASFTAHVDHQGLHNQLTVPAIGIVQEELIEDFDPDNVHGFAMLLPPGLRPSQEISIRPMLELIDLEVGKQQQSNIGVHKLDLLSTGMLYNKQILAIIECDDNGIIYRLTAKGQNLQIDLDSIKDAEGEVQWDRTQAHLPTAN